MGGRLRWLAAAVAALVPALVPVAGAHAQEADLQVLLIGSSLSRGIKRPLQRIFESRGVFAEVKAVAPAWADLQYHAQSDHTAFVLGSRQWDVVFLQQNSVGLSQANGYQAVRDLFADISAMGAKTKLFMTWRDRDVSPTHFSWDLLRGNEGDDYGYVPIAYDLNISVAPAGWAVREARMMMQEPPPLDLWKGGLGHHLSVYGQYLSACVVYAVLTGQNPQGVWAPLRFDSATTAFLQSMANRVVFASDGTWNLKN